MRHSPVENGRLSIITLQLDGLHVILEGFRRGRLVDGLVGPFAVAAHWKGKMTPSALKLFRSEMDLSLIET